MTLLSRFSLPFVLLTSALGGCPGHLENEERFSDIPACRSDIDVRALFVEKCGSAICHGGQSSQPAGGLVLTSADLANELVGVPSTQCDGLLRVDPDDPDQSFLLGKLIEPPAGCGDRMPLVGILTQDEIACIRAFIHDIADEAVTPSDAGTDAGTDAGVDAATDSGTDAEADAAIDLDASADADLDGGG